MSLELSLLAKEALTALKRTNGVPDDEVMRLVPQDSGSFALEVGPPHDTDRVIEHETLPIIAVSEAADEALADAVLDLGSGDQNGELVLRQKPLA